MTYINIDMNIVCTSKPGDGLLRYSYEHCSYLNLLGIKSKLIIIPHHKFKKQDYIDCIKEQYIHCQNILFDDDEIDFKNHTLIMGRSMLTLAYLGKKDYTKEQLLTLHLLFSNKLISVYSEKALTRIIILLKNKNQQIEAIKYMEKLLEIASFEEKKRFAKFNLMQTYFESQEIEKAIMFSDDILKLENLDERIYWDAHSIRARSFIVLKDSLKAAQSYKLLEKAPVGEIVAEATYFRAFLLNKEKKYIESNKLINKIARSSSQESNWNVKALLLLAKNYYALADPFQAIFVLESLIENFTMHPEIVKEAKELKESYNMSFKNENSSTVNKENQ